MEKQTPILNRVIIFTKGYYSVAMLMGPPSTDSIPSNMGREVTDAEKLGLYEQWKWFVGISDGYEVKGSTVVLSPLAGVTLTQRVWLELQVTVPLAPLAVRSLAVPLGMVIGPAGEIASRQAGGVTGKVAVCVQPADWAVIVTVPAPVPRTST